MAKNKIEQFYEDKGYDVDKLLHPERIDNGKIANTEEFIERLHQAKYDEDGITIFSDYDADGVLSGTLAFEALLKLGFKKKHLHVYAPSRKEGYGWTEDKFNDLIEKDSQPDLLLLVDNGINTLQLCKKMNDQGTDVLIADHHMPGGPLFHNEHTVVVDPAIDDGYLFKGLSATGVIWKLLNAYNDEFEGNVDMDQFLDLVGLSCATDVMPVLDENRWYMKKGLEIMNSDDSRPAWTALKEHEKRDLSYHDFGWLVGPLVNAVSRMNGDATLAFRFILNDGEDKSELAEELFKLNDAKKQTTQKAMENAVTVNAPIIVTEGVSAAFAGLVASKMTGKLGMPILAVVKYHEDGKDIYRGSARSIPGFDLLKEFKQVDGLQIDGHAGAAGISFDDDDKEYVREQTSRIVNLWKEEHDEPGQIDYDFEVNDITRQDLHILDAFEPFGNGLDVPTVHASIELDDSIKKMRNGHISFMKNDDHPKVVFWNGTNQIEDLIDKGIEQINGYGTVELNTFAGRTAIQMTLNNFDVKK